MSTYPKGLGTRHHSAKMNAAKVRQARKSFDTGRWTTARLAAKYDITWQSMDALLKGRTWRHVT